MSARPILLVAGGAGFIREPRRPPVAAQFVAGPPPKSALTLCITCGPCVLIGTCG